MPRETPTAAAIRAMGDKARAKRTMAALGLPTVPGSDGVVADVATALDALHLFAVETLADLARQVEQFVVGRHDPTGLTGLFDGA